MKAPIMLAALLGALAATAHAADIYRWVDDEGHVHMSDAVPDKYRDRAKRYDSKSFDASAADQRDAQARAKRDKDRLEALERERNAPSTAVVPASAAASAAKGEEESACDRLWRAYFNHAACLGPYRFSNRWGAGVRAEGFDACGPALLDPYQRCGPAPRRLTE